jgi:hypothetical protein
MTQSAKRRDPQSSSTTPQATQKSWQEVFAALDAADFPEAFMGDRAQGVPESREPL